MSLSFGFALHPADNSADFANAIRAITGDGVTPYGGRFAINSVNGFTVTLSAGYAFAAGRWLKNDEPHRLTVNPSSNTADRTDALVCRVDYSARKAALEILVDVDPDAIRANPTVLRNGDEYNVFLYFIHVKRGATSLAPPNLTDLRADKRLCGSVVPYSSIAGDVLYIYNYLLSGIDEEVARLIGQSKKAEEKADAAIVQLDEALKKVSGAVQVGELIVCRRVPPDDDSGAWLLCDGSAVPSEYATLIRLIGRFLPNISGANDRYRTYIYGGSPEEPEPGYDGAIVGIAIVDIARI